VDVKRKPTKRPATVIVESLSRVQGQLAALIDDMASVKSRLDKLEVVRAPSTTEPPAPPAARYSE
jgi:hypothetical protein